MNFVQFIVILISLVLVLLTYKGESACGWPDQDRDG
jgi:hypothetical protein